jgi:peroxiredoxin
MNRMRHLNFNDPAPDIEIFTTDGETIRLSALWSEHPLLLAFTRHFGCTQCKEMLDLIAAGQAEIQQAGLRIAIVTQGTPQSTLEFRQKFAPNLFFLADPDRRAYAAYGLERGSLFQVVLNPKVWNAISGSRKKGYLLEPPPQGQDALQMSGLFIISTDGHIDLPYYYDNIADHPPFDLLLHGVLSTRWGQPFNGPLGPID